MTIKRSKRKAFRLRVSLVGSGMYFPRQRREPVLYRKYRILSVPRRLVEGLSCGYYGLEVDGEGNIVLVLRPVEEPDEWMRIRRLLEGRGS